MFIEVLDLLTAFKVFGPDFIVILAVGVYRFDSCGLTNLLWLGGIVIGGIRVLISDLPGVIWQDRCGTGKSCPVLTFYDARML